jgi:N-acetylglutamate synthase-like GNAT family acetyltransferase
MQIRLATLTDIPSIMQLIGELVPVMQAAGNFQWDDAYPNPEVFENDIALKRLWVADAGNSIAGIAALTTDQEPEYADADWDPTETAIVVHRLAVSINHQGKGVASKLMQQAELVARGQGINVLRVDTNSTNPAAQQLFPKLGYVYAGEIGLGFRPGMRFFCYEKRL